MNRLRNRAAVKIRLVEVGGYAMTDVALYAGRTETIAVRHTWDGGPIIASALFLGIADGPSEPVSLGTTALTEDRWELQCSLAIVDCPDGPTAEVAAEAALNAFDLVLRRLKRLVDPEDEIPTADPPVSASEPAPWDVGWGFISTVTGPYHTFARPNGTGQITGVCDFTITFLTSLK